MILDALKGENMGIRVIEHLPQLSGKPRSPALSTFPVLMLLLFNPIIDLVTKDESVEENGHIEK
jgi:hypothetical protein